MAEELNVKIKADGAKLVEELKRIGIVIDELNKRSSKIIISTNASDVTKDIKDINDQLNKLGGKQSISVTLSAGNVLQRLNSISNALSDIKANNKVNITLGTGGRLSSALTTLRTIRDTVNTVNRRNLSINGSVKVGGIGNAISEYDRVVTKLNNIKENSKVSVRYESTGFSTAYMELSSIDKLLKNIKANSRVTSTVRINSRVSQSGSSSRTGGVSSRQPAMGDSAFDLSNTDVIGYAGRMSKGLGSALEVVSRLLYKAENLGGAFGEAARSASAITAGVAVAGGGMYLLVGLVENLVSGLDTARKLIVSMLQPGLEYTAHMELLTNGLAGAIASIGQMNGEQVKFNDALVMSNALMKQLSFEAIKIGAKPEELTGVFRSILEPGLQANMKTSEIKRMASTLTTVGKEMGLNDSILVRDAADIIMGKNAGRTKIGQQLGITDADIAQAKSSAGGLYAFLQDRLSGYMEANENFVNTLEGKWSQLQGYFTLASASLVSPFIPALKEAITYIEQYFGTIEQDQQTGEDVFKPSPQMGELLTGLENLGLYLASAIDYLVAWAEAFTDTDDPIQAVVTLLEDMIGTVVTLITTLATFGLETYKIINGVVSFFESLYAAIMKCVNAVGYLWAKMLGDSSGADSMWKQVERYQKLEDDLVNYGKDTTKDKNTIFGTNGGKLTQEFRAILEKSKAQSSNQGGTPSNLDDLKTRFQPGPTKEQISASQKSMQEQVQVLKDNLADQLDIFKRTMASVEVSFKNNQMSIESYFTAKAQNEQAESQAKLDELAAEREVVANALYSNEDDRNKALSKIDRQMSIYARNLADSAKALQEVTAIQGEYTNILATIQSAKGGTGEATGQITNATAQLESYGASKGITTDIMDKIIQESIKQGVDPRLATAIMMQESGGNQSAVSPTGAIGLMQLMPDTANYLGVNPYDAGQNIAGGVQYLASLLQQFNGDIEKTMAAYNAGPQAVKDAGGVPNYAETKNYVNKVSGTYSDISNTVPDMRPYMQSYASEKSQALLTATSTGVNAGLDAGFNKWNGQVMDNARNGCVEAVTKIGSSFSSFLGDELAKGVVNVDVLRENAKSAGIPEIPYDASQVKAGDVVVFDGDEHVLIYKGGGKVVGNYSNRGQNGSISEGTIANQGQTPTSIIQTGSYGLSNSALSMATNLTTQTGLQAKQAVNQRIDDNIAILKEFSDIYGNNSVIAERMQAIRTISTKLEKARAENDTVQISELQGILDSMLKKIDVKYITQDLENSVKSLQLSAKVMAQKIALGLEDAGKAISKYNGYVNDINSPIKVKLDRLKVLMAQAEQAGNISEYYTIRASIEKIYTSLADIFKSFVQKIDDSATFKTNLIDNSQYMTESEKKGAKNQIAKDKATQENVAYAAELNTYIKRLESNLNEYSDKSSLLNSAEYTSMDSKDPRKTLLQTQLADLKSAINELQFTDIPGVQQLIKLNEELMKTPSLMTKVHLAAKESFEDGLNTFLTSNLGNAKELAAAFKDLAVTILQSLRKVFAQAITKDFMKRLFPDTESPKLLGTSKKASNYSLLGSAALSFNPEQTSPITSYNPFADKSSSVYKNIPSIWNNNSGTKTYKDDSATANGLANSTNNLASAYESALTSMDSTVAGLIARINSSATRINSLVSTLSTQGVSTTTASADSGSSDAYSFKYNGLHFATGGIVNGEGTGTSDSVPTMLSNGEGVITAQRVSQLGTNFIHAVNAGNFSAIYASLPHFAEGGVVGDTGAQTTARGLTSFADSLGSKVSMNNNMNIALVRDENEAMQHFMKSTDGQRIMLDFSRKNARLINTITK